MPSIPVLSLAQFMRSYVPLTILDQFSEWVIQSSGLNITPHMGIMYDFVLSLSIARCVPRRHKIRASTGIKYGSVDLVKQNILWTTTQSR